MFQSWSKKSGRFQRNIRPNIERLQILKFKPSNVGEYQCTVATSEGYKQEITVSLRIKSDQPTTTEPTTQPPIYTNAPINTRPQAQLSARLSEHYKDIKSGDNFEITCQVTGSPQPRIIWMFNQEPISDGQYQLHPRGETLYGRQVSKEINGNIVCRALGQDGQFKEDSVLINVLESKSTEAASLPIEVSVTPVAATPSIGESLELKCMVENIDANYMFDWSRQDRQPLPGDSRLSQSRDMLTLNNLQTTDSGVYVCHVIDRNTGLEHKGYSTLVVLETAPQKPEETKDPLKVDVLPEIAELVQNQDAEFTCKVNVDDENVILVWKKVNGNLFFYLNIY